MREVRKKLLSCALNCGTANWHLCFPTDLAIWFFSFNGSHQKAAKTMSKCCLNVSWDQLNDVFHNVFRARFKAFSFSLWRSCNVVILSILTLPISLTPWKIFLWETWTECDLLKRESYEMFCLFSYGLVQVYFALNINWALCILTNDRVIPKTWAQLQQESKTHLVLTLNCHSNFIVQICF